MGKKSRKKLKSRVSEPVPEQKEVVSKISPVTLWGRNVLALGLVALVLVLLYIIEPGYRWLWDEFLTRNLEDIRNFPNLTIDRKQDIRTGYDHAFVRTLRDYTPEDAIILMPPDSIIRTAYDDKEFKWIHSKAWVTYFVYPRKIVYEDEKDKNKLYPRADWIAVINYWGYDLVDYDYPEDKKLDLNIIPMKYVGE